MLLVGVLVLGALLCVNISGQRRGGVLHLRTYGCVVKLILCVIIRRKESEQTKEKRVYFRTKPRLMLHGIF